MKRLSELLQDVTYEVIQGDPEVLIGDLTNDSREIKEGSAFFCFIGALTDGHKYIPKAVQAGAKALVIQRGIEEELKESGPELLKEVTIVKTEDTRGALAFASAEFFDHPAKKMLTVGVTGTKGKTSITSMIQKILEKAGKKVGTIGTVGAFTGEDFIKTETTTPESLDIERFMDQMVKNGCDACVMEVSSQALMLHRVSGILFDYGLFTNLSPDHIGGAEHKDMADYIHCKSLLFRQCRHGHFNADDEHVSEMIKECTCDVTTFSCHKDSDLKAEDIAYLREAGFLGMSFRTEGSIEDTFKVSAPGEFSVYNALSAISVCHAAGIDTEVIKEALMEIHVRGRMEPVHISPRFTLLIDYAHNAVAVESILKAMRKYEPKRIVSLFGCGGNRSKLRRYEMGEMSGLYADFSILTEDNSRLEDVNDIIADIEIGIGKTDGEYIVIPDRKDAIRYSIENAREGDIILLLGKGHEDYQDKGGVKRPFDERVIIQEILDEIGWKYE